MLALSLPARADNIKPKNFPDCIKYKLADGTAICGYTELGDWKKVLRADAELTAKKKLLELERKRTTELGAQLLDFKGQVKAYQGIVSVLDARVKALVADLLETDRKYQLERVKPRWGSAAAWTTAAVATAVLGGFVMNDVF